MSHVVEYNCSKVPNDGENKHEQGTVESEVIVDESKVGRILVVEQPHTVFSKLSKESWVLSILPGQSLILSFVGLQEAHSWFSDASTVEVGIPCMS